MSAASEVRALFRTFLREGRKFPNYNVREYIKRRAGEGFREGAAADQATAAQLVSHAKEELLAVKRQSLVYGLYGRKVKNVLEIDLELKRRH